MALMTAYLHGVGGTANEQGAGVHGHASRPACCGV